MAVPAGKVDPTLREQKNSMFKPNVPANQPGWGVCTSPLCGFVARLPVFIWDFPLGWSPGFLSVFSCLWRCGSLLQELINLHLSHLGGSGGTVCSLRQGQALGSLPELLGISSPRLEEDPQLEREMHLWILGLPQGAPEAPKGRTSLALVTWHISQFSSVNDNYNQPWP